MAISDLPNPLDFLEPGAIALLITFLFTVIGTMAVAFVKKWAVPGSMYDREVARNEKMATSLESLTNAIEELTREVRYRGGK